jgi:hypothetical protein
METGDRIKAIQTGKIEFCKMRHPPMLKFGLWQGRHRGLTPVYLTVPSITCQGFSAPRRPAFLISPPG